MNSSNDYAIKKQSRDDELVLNAAVKRIFENTKKSLGELLIQGLYLVSKKNPQDPFHYLGQWLLIQSDIIDEKKIEQNYLANDV